MRARTVLVGFTLVSIAVVCAAVAAKQSLEEPLTSPEHWTQSDPSALGGEMAAAIARLNPKDSRYQARAGEILLYAGHAADAESTFARAADLDKNDDETMAIIAVAYSNAGRWKEADEWFSRATQIDAKDVDHVVEWGISQWKRGDKKKAADLFVRALSAEPGTERLYYKIGRGIAR